MTLAALVIAILSLAATIFVARLVQRKNERIMRRLEAIMIADKTIDEVQQIERLTKDLENNKEKRGRVVKREDGTWGIDWSITVGGGTVKPRGKLRKVRK